MTGVSQVTKGEPSRWTKMTKPSTTTSTAARATVRAPARSRQQVSPCDDLHILIAKRAYELHRERGYRHGHALDDWLEAEREILGEIPPI